MPPKRTPTKTAVSAAAAAAKAKGTPTRGASREPSVDSVHREITPAVAPAQTSPEILLLIQMMQQQNEKTAELMAQTARENRAAQEAAQEKQDRALHAQQKSYELQIELLKTQLSSVSVGKKEQQKPPTTKAPIFDLNSDKEQFPLWKSKWETHIKGHKIDQIEDEKEKAVQMMMQLNACVSDFTLQWFRHQNFSPEQLEDAEFLIQALEKHIKDGENPIVQMVELGFIERYSHETADHLIQKINEKTSKCEFDSISNYRDHQQLLTIIRAVEPHIRRKLLLAKVDTYQKAIDIVKAEEQATNDTKQCTAPTQEASANATSGYKKFKQQQHLQNFPTQQPAQQQQQQKTGHDRSKCMRCGTAHAYGMSNCPALGKTCAKCGKPDHFAVVCQSHKWAFQNSSHAFAVEACEMERTLNTGYANSITASTPGPNEDKGTGWIGGPC